MIKRSSTKNAATLSFYSQGEQNNQKVNHHLVYETEFSYAFTSDALEFYRQVYDLKALQKAEILSFEINEAKGFTVYQIQVDTIHLSYQIWKRYSEFLSWFEKVKEFVEPQTAEVFPPKKYLNRMNRDFIELRQQQLNDFIISFISNAQPQLVSFSFLDFIEVRRQYIIHSIKFTGPQGSFLMNKKTNPDEEQIIDFIEQLNSGMENLTHIFGEIQNFFLKQKPRLTNESINSLFLGCKQFQGLIAIIGSLAKNESDSHFICSVGLKLMANLFDYEINRDAETFIKVFTQLALKMVVQLSLSRHIISENSKTCKHHSLKILELYLLKNNIRKKDQILHILQDNENSYEEFAGWYQQRHRDGLLNHVGEAQNIDLQRRNLQVHDEYKS